MAKAPQIFKEEDFRNIDHQHTLITPIEAALTAKRIFQKWHDENLTVGYFISDTPNFIGTIHPDDENCDYKINYWLEPLEPLELEVDEVYFELGKRICGIHGIDEDLSDILLSLLDECGKNLTDEK